MYVIESDLTQIQFKIYFENFCNSQYLDAFVAHCAMGT